MHKDFIATICAIVIPFNASQIYPSDAQKMRNKNGKNLIRHIQSEFIAHH